MLMSIVFCSFQSANLKVFELNIRYVGGFLAMYALTGDKMYKEKAQYVADKLLPAFHTPTGIPDALVDLQTGVRGATGVMIYKHSNDLLKSHRKAVIMDGQMEIIFYQNSVHCIWSLRI